MLTPGNRPCRIAVYVSGFECFVFNRTPVYAEIIDRMQKKADPPLQTDPLESHEDPAGSQNSRARFAKSTGNGDLQPESSHDSDCS